MQRAHRNMFESLVLFAALVFFWAPLLFVFVYGAGIAWLRTGVWAVSVVGMGMIAGHLL